MVVINAKYASHRFSSAVQENKGTQEASSFAKVLATANGENETSVGTHQEVKNSSPVYSMHTNNGARHVDLDKHFSSRPDYLGKPTLTEAILLLPTKQNVENLSKYSEKKFRTMMDEYDIPLPPEQIKFDQEGKLILPENYLFKEELKEAFALHPEIEAALKTTAALASHYAGFLEAQQYRDEMATARSHADKDRISQKYSYLFDPNRPKRQMMLSFLEDGSMLVGESGNG